MAIPNKMIKHPYGSRGFCCAQKQLVAVARNDRESWTGRNRISEGISADAGPVFLDQMDNSGGRWI